MSEMTENPENPDNLPARATESPTDSNNESEALELMKAIYRSNDTSGDWNKNGDEWYIHSRSLPEEILSFEADNSTEWKYRNLYSMPSPNTHPAYWSPRRAVATSANKSDESTKEAKNYLEALREYLASYQESHGTPRDEYSFAALIRVMGQATGRSLLALFYIVVNITPIAQIFLYILRFVLDKMISIRNTSNCPQAIVKYAVLGIQLLCIYVCLVFIFGFIVLPILKMVIAILAKIMLYD